MSTHKSLRHGIIQAGGSMNGAHRAPKRTARRWAWRGIAALTLALASLTAVALAVPGHSSPGRTHTPAAPTANSADTSPGSGSAISSITGDRPWMY